MIYKTIASYVRRLRRARGTDRAKLSRVRPRDVGLASRGKLIGVLAAALMRACVFGMKHAQPQQVALADDAVGAVSKDAISFEEARQIVGGQVPMSKSEFGRLDAQLRYRAFTVAALATVDAIDAVRKHILRAVDGGLSLREFIADTSKVDFVRSAGFARSAPWYWETVFRTNLHTAYAAGRALQDEKTPPLFYKFSANVDARTTDICRARDGVVRKATDPFWDTNTPPLHYNCRSTRISISKAVAEGYGIGETAVPKQSRPAQRGFGRNPLDKGSFWKLTPAMKERALRYGLAGEVVHLAHMLGMTSYSLELVQGMKTVRKYDSGGFVKESVNREEKSKQQREVRAVERGIATALAERGEKVYLLPETRLPKIKNPDAIVGDRVFEFKSAVSTNAKNIARIIYNTSRDQAEHVVIRIDPSVSLDMLGNELRGERTKYLKQVWVLQGNNLHKWRYK